MKTPEARKWFLECSPSGRNVLHDGDPLQRVRWPVLQSQFCFKHSDARGCFGLRELHAECFQLVGVMRQLAQPRLLIGGHPRAQAGAQGRPPPRRPCCLCILPYLSTLGLHGLAQTTCACDWFPAASDRASFLSHLNRLAVIGGLCRPRAAAIPIPHRWYRLGSIQVFADATTPHALTAMRR